MLLLKHFLQLAVEEKCSQSVNVPGLSRPQPKVVSSNRVGERDTGSNGLNNVPREGNVSSVLEKCKLKSNRGEKPKGHSRGGKVGLLLAIGDFLFNREKGLFDILQFCEELVTFHVAGQRSV